VSSEPDPDANEARTEPDADAAYHVEVRDAKAVQVGEGNTQFIYNYKEERTWTPQPLISVSGKINFPYRGLSAFAERDAAVFFGRETAIAQVLDRMSKCLREDSLLVVSGVSGAGKSSLLRAGVLPRVRGTGLPKATGAASWPCLVLTPGRSPLAELAVLVARSAGVDAASVRSGLAADPAGFALTVRQAAQGHQGLPANDSGEPAMEPPAQERLLLVVDQFEQLFTQCPDEEQRRQFITALHAAATVRYGPDQVPAALVVLVVRADFEARCADYPQLTSAVQTRYLVTSMTELQLRSAITEPAKKAGSSVDDDLVDALIREVIFRRPPASSAFSGPGAPSDAGMLPLLSHALDQTWRSRAGDSISLVDYERTGGIEGAVADSAQRAYEQLTAPQQAAARQVFLQLTATSSDGIDTANRVSRAELTEGRGTAEARNVAAVLEAFASERLLTLAADTVEISHEVLLTSWPLLRDTWLADTHSDRIFRTRFHDAAAAWERNFHDRSYQYSGSLLDAATAIADRINASPSRYPPLSRTELDFLGASKRARHRGELRRRGITATLVALVVGLAALSFVVNNERNTAIAARDAAVSGQLVAQSEALNDTDPVLSRLEGIAAWKVNPSDQARYAMLTAARIPGIAVLSNHDVPLYSAAFSPDGRTLATSDANGKVLLWNTATHKLISDLFAGDNTPIVTMAFNPKGDILVTGAVDGTAEVWDTARNRYIGHVSTGNTTGITSVAFSPDAKILATGNADGTVQLWNTVNLHQIGSLQDVMGAIDAVTFSPDSKILATASTGYVARLWNVATDQEIGEPIGPSEYTVNSPANVVNSVAFSPDGKNLATGSGGDTGRVDLWSVATQKHVGSTLTGDTNGINSVAFSPDGKTLASGSSDDTVRLWNVATDQQIGAALVGGTSAVNSVAFSPDGKTLASVSSDGTARLWDADTAISKPPSTLPGGVGPVSATAFSPNGKLLAIGGSYNTTELWNPMTRQRAGSLIGDNVEGENINAVAFSPAGKILATGSSNGTVWLWNVSTGRQIGSLIDGHAGSVNSIAFSPDGKTLVAGNDDGRARLWDVSTHQEIGSPFKVTFLGGDLQIVQSVALSPDGKTLATGNSDGTVWVWDLATHQRISVFRADSTGRVYSVSFSPDGTILAAGTEDGRVLLWNTVSHQEIGGPLVGASGNVTGLAFSPDSQTLAASSYDGTTRLWDVVTRQQIGAALLGDAGAGQTGFSAAVNSVAFSPNGEQLATGNYDGDVQLWDTSYLTHLAAYLCGAAGQSLSRTQWSQYVPGVAYQNVCP
jgi:WD40 repeat protein